MCRKTVKNKNFIDDNTNNESNKTEMIQLFVTVAQKITL